MIVPANPKTIAQAAALIRDGKLVAFPTETVYGLGADATNGEAVAAIFAAKGRPRFNPLIVHFSDTDSAALAARFDERAQRLAKRFWPGALTLVLPRSEDCPVSRLACAGLDTIAVRVPGHETALALLTETGRPLAAPSANISGAVSPTTAAHVETGLGPKIALILDDGPCRIGVESTVLDLSEETPQLLRPGGVTRAEIESVIGKLPSEAPGAESDEAGFGGAAATEKPRSPGLAGRHYAPSVPLRLNAAAGPVRADEALLAFGANPPPGYKTMLNLSAAGDLAEAAANLFAMLRKLDTGGFGSIAVMPIPGNGLGEAINDRLRRAADPALAATAGNRQIESRSSRQAQ
ncbi:MAG: L-threonylcarbamoyladenylate synthase [Alphaproteobacteria bacterium]